MGFLKEFVFDTLITMYAADGGESGVRVAVGDSCLISVGCRCTESTSLYGAVEFNTKGCPKHMFVLDKKGFCVVKNCFKNFKSLNCYWETSSCCMGLSTLSILAHILKQGVCCMVCVEETNGTDIVYSGVAN